jgi:DNA-binding YbaB/EbfC family protein
LFEENAMFNPLKLQEMMAQAKQMQEQMQEKLGQTIVEASSGGGAVTVKMNGQKQVLNVTIDPGAVASLGGSADDVEMLEDLIAAAFNEAGRRADEAIKSAASSMLGGLNLPPGLLG